MVNINGWGEAETSVAWAGPSDVAVWKPHGPENEVALYLRPEAGIFGQAGQLQVFVSSGGDVRYVRVSGDAEGRMENDSGWAEAVSLLGSERLLRAHKPVSKGASPSKTHKLASWTGGDTLKGSQSSGLFEMPAGSEDMY